MSLQMNLNDAKEWIVESIKERVVPLMIGSPAVGKSALVHQIAKEFGLKVIDLRLSQCDPTDLNA